MMHLGNKFKKWRTNLRYRLTIVKICKIEGTRREEKERERYANRKNK